MTMRHVLRSMKLFRFQLRFALLLTALACADATVPEPFHLRIEPMRTRYAPGDFVEVTIRDAGARGVTYNTCASNLQQFDRGAWRPTRSFEAGGFVCDDALHSLPSGTEAIGTAWRLSADIPDGTYRFQIDGIFGPGEARVPIGERVSGPFLVTRP
jgi:hypothetical protein